MCALGRLALIMFMVVVQLATGAIAPKVELASRTGRKVGLERSRFGRVSDFDGTAYVVHCTILGPQTTLLFPEGSSDLRVQLTIDSSISPPEAFLACIAKDSRGKIHKKWAMRVYWSKDRPTTKLRGTLAKFLVSEHVKLPDDMSSEITLMLSRKIGWAIYDLEFPTGWMSYTFMAMDGSIAKVSTLDLSGVRELSWPEVGRPYPISRAEARALHR